MKVRCRVDFGVAVFRRRHIGMMMVAVVFGNGSLRCLTTACWLLFIPTFF
jgi:hypothetical protein